MCRYLNECEPQTHCEQVKYNSSTNCTKLPNVDPNNICKKHETDEKCVEAKKTFDGVEEETKPTWETETKPTGEAETKPTGESETKPTGESETKPTGEAETNPTGETGPIQGTETDLNKDNKRMLLNLILYTLLNNLTNLYNYN